jgi:hypothetical protein
MVMRKADIAYAAGLFDGEGCITIAKAWYRKPDGTRRYYHALRLTLAMVDKAPVHWLADLFGGSVKPHSPGNKKYRPQWRWEVRSLKAEKMLNAIYPYLKVKRKQADLAFLFRNTYSNSTKKTLPEMFGLREAFFNRMKTIKLEHS